MSLKNIFKKNVPVITLNKTYSYLISNARLLMIDLEL